MSLVSLDSGHIQYVGFGDCCSDSNRGCTVTSAASMLSNVNVDQHPESHASARGGAGEQRDRLLAARHHGHVAKSRGGRGDGGSPGGER
jgi:hypothetical protein